MLAKVLLLLRIAVIAGDVAERDCEDCQVHGQSLLQAQGTNRRQFITLRGDDPKYTKQNPQDPTLESFVQVLQDTNLTLAPTASPTDTALPTMPKLTPTFNVSQGQCEIKGGCVTSPSFPLSYPNDQTCEIRVNEAFFASNVLSVANNDFDTEASWDYLTINWQKFDGRRSPDGKSPTGTIFWKADGSVARTGWRLCTRPKVVLPVVSGAFSIANGTCVITNEGGCIKSHHASGDYGSGEECAISVNGGNFKGPVELDVVGFDTERSFDKLTVNNEEYSGARGPQGVEPSGQIKWVSDGSVVKSGWEICARPASAVRRPE